MAKNEFDITSLTPEQRDARLALDVERLLRFGRRPTAADATSRNDPSREMQFPVTPSPVKKQIRRGRSPAGFAKSKIIFLLFMPRAKRRAF